LLRHGVTTALAFATSHPESVDALGLEGVVGNLLPGCEAALWCSTRRLPRCWRARRPEFLKLLIGSAFVSGKTGASSY